MNDELIKIFLQYAILLNNGFYRISNKDIRKSINTYIYCNEFESDIDLLPFLQLDFFEFKI